VDEGALRQRNVMITRAKSIAYRMITTVQGEWWIIFAFESGRQSSGAACSHGHRHILRDQLISWFASRNSKALL
jgi:hypothetical protein